jgi:hypothetical protein
LRQLLWRQDVRSLTSGFLVFLVVAWVGLWYPLDLLFFARQPVRREIGVLTAMLTLQLVIRSEESPETSMPAIRPIEGGAGLHGNPKQLEE